MSVYFSLHRCCLSASASLLFHVSELESPGGRRSFRSTLERVRTLGRAASSGPEGNISFRLSLELSQRPIELRSDRQPSNRFIAMIGRSTQCFEGLHNVRWSICLLPSVIYGTYVMFPPAQLRLTFDGSPGMSLTEKPEETLTR